MTSWLRSRWAARRRSAQLFRVVLDPALHCEPDAMARGAFVPSTPPAAVALDLSRAPAARAVLTLSTHHLGAPAPAAAAWDIPGALALAAFGQFCAVAGSALMLDFFDRHSVGVLGGAQRQGFRIGSSGSTPLATAISR